MLRVWLGIWPFCRRSTFSIRRDDSVGKCFHPACGRAVTEGHLAPSYTGSLYQVLDKIKDDCHKHLLTQNTPGNGYGWEYVIEDRNIDPRVVNDLAELRAVPTSYDVAAAFRPVLDALESRRKELAAKIEESHARRLGSKQEREGDHRAGRQKPGSLSGRALTRRIDGPHD